MICRILHLQSEQEWVKASQWLDGRFNPGDGVEGSVREILANVREKGDEALIDYTRRFDCPEFAAPLRVSEQDIAWAAASISPEHREQISEAAHNIRTFHKEQLEKSWFQTRPDGSILGQRVLPVDRVGLYVPGGQGGNTPLLSSMLMHAIPALVAGVPRVAVCTPPRKDGTINPHILAAAHLLDIDEIYRVGGAWSIGAMAYGTQSIDPVDVIAGPGNIYVATAKRLVQGTVGIDMVAGPSEVLVVADSSARPHWLAADMLSQAEHDMLASAILLTDDLTLAGTGKAVQPAAQGPDRQQVPHGLGRHRGGAQHHDRRGHRQPRGSRASGTVRARSLGPAAPHPPCRGHFHGPAQPRTRGGLLRGPQPCAAHPADRALLFRALRPELLQKNQHRGHFAGLPAGKRACHCFSGPSGRAGGPRPFRGDPQQALVP